MIYIKNINKSIIAGHMPSSLIYRIIKLSMSVQEGTDKIERLIKICILCQEYINKKNNSDLSLVESIMKNAISCIDYLVNKSIKLCQNQDSNPQLINLSEAYCLEKVHSHSNYLNVIYNAWLSSFRRNGLENNFIYWFETVWLPKSVNEYGSEILIAKLNEKILYLNKIQSYEYIVEIGDGFLRYRNKKIVDTTNFKSFHHNCANLGIFVLCMNNRLFIHSHEFNFRHSSFTSGAPVYCAGEIGVKEGVIQCVSRNSGHYKPSAYSLYNFLNVLVSHKINIDAIRVHFAVGDPSFYVAGRDFYNSPDKYCA